MNQNHASKPIIQLSANSQNNCVSGNDIFAEVVAWGGGQFLMPGNPQPPYPASNEPVGQFVHLPVPPPPIVPTPTWFFEITNGLDNFWVEIVVRTPGYPPCFIRILGANLPGWVIQNQKEKTNQIYQSGDCGIFGYAQEEEIDNYVQWIYSITAGTPNPKVHPGG